MLLPRAVRTLLAVLTLAALASAPASSDTLELESIRIDVPVGFVEVVPTAAKRARFLGMLDIPRYYAIESTEFRLFERGRADRYADAFLVMRVPGRSRNADDFIVVDHFCRSAHQSRRSPELEPMTCRLRTTSRDVTGIEVRCVREYAGFGPATQDLFLLPRRDDMIVLFLELVGDRRTQADALWEPLLATFENEGLLPLEATRGQVWPYVLRVLRVVAAAVVLGLTWAWWRRRRAPKVVPRKVRPPEGPEAGLTG